MHIIHRPGYIQVRCQVGMCRSGVKWVSTGRGQVGIYWSGVKWVYTG